jgi:hypothetical protein
MEKLTILIADPDERYTAKLASFVRTGEFSKQLSLACFTHPEALSQAVNPSGRRWSLYVIHESLAESFVPLIGRREIVLLSEQPVTKEGGIDKRIAKYQPLDRFFAKLLSLCIESSKATNDRQPESGRCRVSAVYSAAGGAGKTTVALNMAAQLAQRGKQVFLLNLEPLPSLPPHASESEGGGLSRFLYDLRAQHRQLVGKLEQYKTYDPALKVSTFAPPENLLELKEMTEKDTVETIRCIRASGVYEELVIDLESAFHPRVLGALGECDQICWLLIDDTFGRMKSRQAIRLLRDYERESDAAFIEKIRYWQNKCVDRHPCDYGNEFLIERTLPYIPEWKNSKPSARPMPDSPLFNESIADWAREEGE